MKGQRGEEERREDKTRGRAGGVEGAREAGWEGGFPAGKVTDSAAEISIRGERL